MRHASAIFFDAPQVIPDERDVREMMGPHEYRAEYLVAQENLQLVKDSADMMIEHRELGKAFEGFDFTSNVYRAPHKLRYCFPQRTPSTPPAASQTEERSQTEAMHAVVDEMLLELLTYLRASLSFARTSDAAQRASQVPVMPSGAAEHSSSVTGAVAALQAPPASPADGPLAVSLQDLLSMMKFAQTQEQAIYVESLMWLIWVAHTSPDINKLMRLSMSHAKRGNLKQAIEIVTLASELDPSYGEAYNKRASYHHFQLDYDACIVDAQKALQIFPEHVGALSGLGLCYEHKGGRPIHLIGI
jgi:tetratricopeptide (TPR) repeat protein